MPKLKEEREVLESTKYVGRFRINIKKTERYGEYYTMSPHFGTEKRWGETNDKRRLLYIDIISAHDLTVQNPEFKSLREKPISVDEVGHWGGRDGDEWFTHVDHEAIDKVVKLLGAYSILQEREEWLTNDEISYSRELARLLFVEEKDAFSVGKLNDLYARIPELAKKEEYLDETYKQGKEVEDLVKKDEDAKAQEAAQKIARKNEKKEKFNGFVKSIKKPFTLVAEGLKGLSERLKSEAAIRKHEKAVAKKQKEEKERTRKENARIKEVEEIFNA